MKINVESLPPEGIDLDLAAEYEDPVPPVELARGQAFRPAGRPSGTLHFYESEGDVFVKGDLRLPTTATCSRCLAEFPLALRAEVDVVYMPASAAREEEGESAGETEFTAEDAAVSLYDGEKIDVTELLNEQLYLNAPQQPLCRPDCRGLCPSCGADLNANPCSCAPERMPSPFEKLRGLKLPS